MTRHSFIYSPDESYFRFYTLYALFLLNAYVVRSSTLTSRLWHLIKIELFYIDGACQHSGRCCHHIQLSHQGRPLDHIEDWVAYLHDNPSYQRFKPDTRKDGHIPYYSCSCLSDDHYCLDYKNRPEMCHLYPANRFMDEETLYSGCGFTIRRKLEKAHFSHPLLVRFVDAFSKVCG